MYSSFKYLRMVLFQPPPLDPECRRSLLCLCLWQMRNPIQTSQKTNEPTDSRSRSSDWTKKMSCRKRLKKSNRKLSLKIQFSLNGNQKIQQIREIGRHRTKPGLHSNLACLLLPRVLAHQSLPLRNLLLPSTWEYPKKLPSLSSHSM